MKIQSVSIVLLLTASALAGCAGSSDSDIDHELAGTSWIILPQFEGYDAGQMIDEFGYEYGVSIRVFGEDGSVEDFGLAGDEGCPFGTVSHSEDESLCEVDMSIVGEMSSSVKWRIDDNDNLVISTAMVMGGDNFAMEMDEMTCNMMADMMWEHMSHYSIETNINWLENENACEYDIQMKMKVILENGSLVYHMLNPVRADDMMAEACSVGIEWTGQVELSESEISTFDVLLSQCPDLIPLDAVVWDCELHIWLDSLPDLSEQSFNDSASNHPGYPEWCGRIIEDGLALDGSESNLPPAEEMYGLNYGGGVYARSGTHWMDSWFSQEDCSGEGEYWDENYDMCAIPVDCPAEADSQLIYEECLPWQWARYHWSGDYLYIGMPSDRLW
tara:strand:+ start:105 stop:1265 length:1161 start_codon:yes stop_codon:yes gene_type:complete